MMLWRPRLSNIETSAQMDNIQHWPSPSQALGVEARRGAHRVEALMERPHRGGGWLLSGIVCINILILGCTLVSGSAFHSVAITDVHRQIFLIILLLLTILWMLFYMRVTSQKDPNGVFKDSHAGPVWLRGGLLLFGLLSLLMDIFKIGASVGYLQCDSVVKVAFPVVQAAFLFVQTYFLWCHAKDCVQRHTNFTRCGLTLTLSTNLVVWMAAVTEESVHQMEISDLNVDVFRALFDDRRCNCSHSVCETFKEAFYYLYPFNIEYSLFASAVTYVMWTNVGRPAEAPSSPQSVKFSLKDVCLGSVTGTLLVVAGLVTFVVYKVDILTEDEKNRNEALLIHFITNAVIVSLMCLSTAIGCVVYRLDRREHVSAKNPTRSLDARLLLAASLGQFLISYFTVVAVAATGGGGHLDALNLSWAVLTVLQLGLQNYFIVEGLYREPFHVTQAGAPHDAHAHACREHPEVTMAQEGPKSKCSVTSSRDKPSWKRRVLKEVCAFLLFANIILWIMPAFGARPQFDHPIEIKFYKFSLWATIVNIGLPFGIFYRMHSVASLFEVYLNT
ncbi:proton channel OTOP2 isoform X1 [Pungitius pungitius]|uniref:proton channel OTOP2 isoform X1 n=2 Tax=Pungitius pungitius TaxID=134920 RepID=UPI002E131D15